MKTKTNDTENGSILKPLLLAVAGLAISTGLVYSMVVTERLTKSVNAIPEATPAATPVPSDLFTFRVGDTSWSHSEKWEMTITGQTDGSSRKLTMTKFGKAVRKSFYLPRNQNYKITLEHKGSKYPIPDHDWDAQIWWTKADGSSSGWQPDAGVLTPRAKSPRIVKTASGGLWVLENDDGLMGTALVGEGKSPNRTIGKTAWLKKADAKILEPIGSYDAAENSTSSWKAPSLRSSATCYHFDFQGVVSGCRRSYPLIIKGKITSALSPSPQGERIKV